MVATPSSDPKAIAKIILECKVGSLSFRDYCNIDAFNRNTVPDDEIAIRKLLESLEDIQKKGKMENWWVKQGLANFATAMNALIEEEEMKITKYKNTAQACENDVDLGEKATYWTRVQRHLNSLASISQTLQILEAESTSSIPKAERLRIIASALEAFCLEQHITPIKQEKKR